VFEIVELPDCPVGDVVEESFVGAVDDPSVEDLCPGIKW
jgi:hypothetical protein